MIYSPETYYFDTKDFPFDKAFLSTAQTVATWCASYKVRLVAPKSGVKAKERTGIFTDDQIKNAETVAELYDWIRENSGTGEVFFFSMRSGQEQAQNEVATFDHHDDTCCWALNITEEQFKILQANWKEAGLPEDLFYSVKEWENRLR